MTREEAIAILIREIDEDPFMRTEHRELIHGALNMAIKALEQESILDKIRAEIEQRFGIHGNLSLYNKALNDVLEIIDKYKGRK